MAGADEQRACCVGDDERGYVDAQVAASEAAKEGDAGEGVKLPRFVALSLLIGYGWRTVGGLLWLGYGLQFAGAVRDAELHAIFVGFVFSMIFGHALVIFPAVLGLAIPVRRVFYVHLALLHVGVALRVTGALGGGAVIARDSTLLNAMAIRVFFVLTAGSALARRA